MGVPPSNIRHTRAHTRKLSGPIGARSTATMTPARTHSPRPCNPIQRRRRLDCPAAAARAEFVVSGWWFWLDGRCDVARIGNTPCAPWSRNADHYRSQTVVLMCSDQLYRNIAIIGSITVRVELAVLLYSKIVPLTVGWNAPNGRGTATQLKNPPMANSMALNVRLGLWTL